MIHNGELKVRKLEKEDNVLLAKWLSNPTVLEFYEGRDNAFDLEKVNKCFMLLERKKANALLNTMGTQLATFNSIN